MDVLYFLIASILSTIFFRIIFTGLNKSMLKLFVPLQNWLNNTKSKGLYRIITYVFLIILCVFINNYFQMHYIVLGIIIGGCNSLINVIFNESIGSSIN